MGKILPAPRSCSAGAVGHIFQLFLPSHPPAPLTELQPLRQQHASLIPGALVLGMHLFEPPLHTCTHTHTPLCSFSSLPVLGPVNRHPCSQGKPFLASTPQAGKLKMQEKPELLLSSSLRSTWKHSIEITQQSCKRRDFFLPSLSSFPASLQSKVTPGWQRPLLSPPAAPFPALATPGAGCNHGLAALCVTTLPTDLPFLFLSLSFSLSL